MNKYILMTNDDLYIELTDMCINKKPFDDTIEDVFTSKKIVPNIENGILLYFSAAYGNLKMIKLLKKYGADFSINEYESLRISAQNGHLDCVKFILNEFPNIDLEQFKNHVCYKTCVSNSRLIYC